MRILITGGDGMLGHQLLLSLQHRHDVRVTLRQAMNQYKSYNLFTTANSYSEIDVRDENKLLNVLADFKPEAVINAVGIVKQRKSAKEVIPSLEINALFPHRLSEMCQSINARMIHLSTDCVFSGSKGKYRENDPSDAIDLYGKTKYLGEVQSPHCVTLRSSIIGLELARNTGLIEWFLAQQEQIKGFKRAIYSGFTTQEMSRLIETILVKHPDLSGVWHVASEAINKYDLLQIFCTMLDRKKIPIEPDEVFICDRSLNGDAFKKATGYQAPHWNKMLRELADQVNQRNNCQETA